MHINKDAGLPPQPDAYLMAVSITPTGDASVATRLFKSPVAMTGATRNHNVTDDDRFLIKSPPLQLSIRSRLPSASISAGPATLHKK
jgi:hypothetical protein